MKKIILFLLLGLLINNPVFAGWTSTGGPIGGLGYDIRIDPNSSTTMYVTDNFAGVVKSEDSGANWTAKNSGI
ncbi:MAG: hypothetical protein HQK84_09615, partial [Nitrospinae bacterium]|nr:hypothetical protein [Nitrospinota bacterium]